MTVFNLFKNDPHPLHFNPGEDIFQEGESGQAMYVITDGEVDILHKGKVIDTAGAGEIIGEMALIDSAPRSATARARTPCKITAVDERRFTFLVQETPMFALQVMRTMSERLRHMLTLTERD